MPWTESSWRSRGPSLANSVTTEALAARTDGLVSGHSYPMLRAHRSPLAYLGRVPLKPGQSAHILRGLRVPACRSGRFASEPLQMSTLRRLRRQMEASHGRSSASGAFHGVLAGEHGRAGAYRARRMELAATPDAANAIASLATIPRHRIHVGSGPRVKRGERPSLVLIFDGKEV